MVIRPRHLPDVFERLFGVVDDTEDSVYDVSLHWKRAQTWDAAIDHAVFRKPIQQPVLTRPQPQSKGD